MVVPVVIVAIAAGGVAAVTGFYFLIRKLVGGQNDDETTAYPKAMTLDKLPKYLETRPLGQMEFIMTKLHEMDKGILAVALGLSMKVPVSDVIMKQTLGKLAKIHPLLKARITKVRETGVPTFEPVKGFSVIYANLNSRTWEDILSQELEKKFDAESGPLWRAVHLPNASANEKEPTTPEKEAESEYPFDTVLILSFHRALVDEGFVAELSAQFMKLLNGEMDKNPTEMETFDLLPPLDVNFTAKDVDPAWYDAMARKIHLITEPKIENIGELNDNDANDSAAEKPEDRKNSPQDIVFMRMNRQKTTKFFDKCAKYEVAVSAALEVAAVIGHSLDDKKKDDVLPMQIEQSIFLKPLLPAIPLEYCGNYSVENVIDTAVPKASEFLESFWNIAASVTDGLSLTMQSAMPVVDVGPATKGGEEKEFPIGLEEAPPPTPPAPRIEGDPAPAPAHDDTPPEIIKFESIRVSTLGACAEADETISPPVRLTGLFGHIGLRREGPALGHCHAAVNDKLCWTLTYRRDKYSKKEAQELLKKTFDCIEKALSLDPKQAEGQEIQGVTPPEHDERV